jgi:Polysaccharide lyase
VNSTFLIGTVNIVQDIVAQGKYAARFDLPAGSPASKCEVLRSRTEALGTDDWYALEVYFPSNWREPSSDFWGLLFAQFDYERLTGPPVGLYAHADHVNVGVESGLCSQAYGCEYNTGNDAGPNNQGTLGYTLRIVPLGTRLAGTWQQFVVHVHHAADSSGLVQGWWRPRGGTWAQTVNWGGYPTVQWSSTQPVDTNYGTVDKIGAYRAASTFPISIWQDGFCIANSFAAAAGCL